MYRKWLVAILAVSILSGCGKNAAFEPVDINTDIDVCDVCNMSITAVNYATEVIMKDGSVEKFDDIGCMVDFMGGATKETGALFVRDANTGEWIEAQKASYLLNDDYWTPMMYGVISFKDDASAELFSTDNGEGSKLTFDEVVEHLGEKGSSKH
ncbi:nitrous oxide reductase accessory protein NosL [Sporosarcina limicola]|uniref:Copper chaperone NosL n=1 Tax=Sporosarcina limicola TaxID=34101 RepID=A0A927MJT6_9BACL|nr:nitrous oxide reductase accessory protein NosL [Sporosarcina limicola]MBE1555908.1 copper chaperone NosL [Sporosarcina limicola]